MGKMKNLVLDIQDDIADGRLSFHAIAAKHSVPFSWVDEVAKEMARQDTELDYIIENDYQDEF